METITQLTAIADGNAKAFTLKDGRSIVVVRCGLNAFAYINRCPHAGVELQWGSDNFLSYDKTQLQCSTHGARFNFQNGYCTDGPCRGRSLSPVSISIENGDIIVD